MAAVCLLSSSVARASNERSLPCSTVQLVSHECLLRGESGLPASRGNASSPPVSYRSSYARFPPFRDNPRSGAKCWIKATSNRGYAFLGATCVFVNLDSSPCQDEVRG